MCFDWLSKLYKFDQKKVSYMKSSLEKFLYGKKKLNMILDQSKVSTYNRDVGLILILILQISNLLLLFWTKLKGEVLTKPEPKHAVQFSKHAVDSETTRHIWCKFSKHAVEFPFFFSSSYFE